MFAGIDPYRLEDSDLVYVLTNPESIQRMEERLE